MSERVAAILQALTQENWPELRERLFEALVEEGLDHVAVEAVLREAARKVGATLGAVRKSWQDYLGPVPEERDNAAAKLVRLAEEAGGVFWHTPSGEAWSTLRRDGHIEHWPVRGREFRLWLAGLYYAQEGRPPYAQALQDALAALEAKALFEGPERPVFTRLAEWEGKLYLDLARPDWKVVEIDPSGWRVLDSERCPVPFRRTPHQKPLPIPQGPGDVRPLLELLHLQDPKDRALVLGWLAGTLNPRGPYPVLLLVGEKGAGKSTAARMLKEVVDPAEGGLRGEPRDVESLMLAARNNLVVAYDNLSKLPGWLSDAFCVLATGGALSKRELYTDASEVVLEAKRPAILTGIGLGVLRDDLADRVARVELPRIPDEDRATEEELWARFAEAHPRILAAVLDAASLALRRKEEVRRRLSSLPRMADWAVWAEAAAPALMLEEGEVVAAFYGMQAELNADLLESDAIAQAFLTLTASWPEGGRQTYAVRELLEALEEAAGLKDAKVKPLEWPRTPQGLARVLPRLQTALRAAGIYLSSWRDPHGKRNLWTLEVRREDFQKGVGEQTPQTPQTPQTLSSTAKTLAGIGAGFAGIGEQTPQETPQGEMPSRRAFAGIAGIAGFTPPLSSKPAQEEVDEWSP